MDMEQALLQALHDNPADDTSWLVLADWLEEQDQPQRAELTRLTVQLRQADDRNQPRRQKRLQELLAAGVEPCVPRLALKLAPRIKLDLTLVPPGVFLMGSPETEDHRESDEGPVHRVTISKGFYLGTFQVTRQQWTHLMGTSPGRFTG